MRINLFHDAGLNPPKFEIMGCGLKVTIFAKKAASTAIGRTTDKTTDKKSAQILDEIRKNPSITNDELVKIVGNITINGIRYHINKMKNAKRIVRRNGKKEGYWETLD